MKMRPVKLKLGNTRNGKLPITIDLDDLVTPHFAFLGLTGAGKSVTLCDIALQAMDQGCGVTVVDPGSGLVNSILAHKAKEMLSLKDASVLRKLRVLDPGNYGVAFGLDLFHFDPARPVHPELHENAYLAWLYCTANTIGQLVQIKQGQVNFEQNARLQRVLTNLLLATGMAIDDHGKHLPLADALVLLQVEHPAHGAVYARVQSFLDRDTLADFERLRRYKRIEDRLRETESTINRLRAIFSPIARAIFGVTGERSLNVRRIIRARGSMLWNLGRESNYLSDDQKTTFGKLAIHMVADAMMTMPRELRRRHILLIDEAAEFASEELEWMLGALRKTGLHILLGAQDLSSFTKKDFDMTRKVVSQCNLVCFQQDWEEDLDILARALYRGTYDRTPLVHEVERHDGEQWLKVVEESFQNNWNQTWSHTKSQQEGNTVQHSENRQISTAASTMLQESTQWQKGHVDTKSRPERGTLSPVQIAHADSAGKGGSIARGIGAARTEAQGSGTAIGHQKMTGTADTTGNGVGGGKTTSEKWVHLPVIKRENQNTGRLEKALTDQIEENKDKIAEQGRQEATIKIKGRAGVHEIRTRNFPDPFRTEKTFVGMVEWAKQEIFAMHDCYFTPDFTPAEEERRVQAFLADGVAPAIPLPRPGDGRRDAGVAKNKNRDANNGSRGEGGPFTE